MTDLPRLTADISGVPVPVTVTASGVFEADFLGQGWRDTTLKELTGRMLAAAKRAAADIRVPFTQALWAGDEVVFRDGFARPQRRRAGPLVRWHR